MTTSIAQLEKDEADALHAKANAVERNNQVQREVGVLRRSGAITPDQADQRLSESRHALHEAEIELGRRQRATADAREQRKRLYDEKALRQLYSPFDPRLMRIDEEIVQLDAPLAEPTTAEVN